MYVDILEVVFIIFAIYYIGSPFYYSADLINDWARKNDLIITKYELRFLFTGPFQFIGNRAIHRLELRDKDGNNIICWTRTGSLFGGNPKEFIIEWE